LRKDSDCVYSQRSFQASSRVGIGKLRFPEKELIIGAQERAHGKERTEKQAPAPRCEKKNGHYGCGVVENKAQAVVEKCE
jgi:hypothetical protein